MSDSSFELLINNSSTQTGQETVHCQNLLRSIPGKRDVYDGLWNDKQVVVKIFSHKFRGWLHLHLEWKGLKYLNEEGLNSPQVFFKGITKDGHHVIVMEKIPVSLTVLTEHTL
jgi:hypothetical protein